MKTNVGTIDRMLRAVVGVVLLYLALASGLPVFDGPLFRYGAILIGIAMLATSAFRICPLYGALGIRTCRAC